ncbi:MAG: hypothetical protein HY291_01180 [Planctomycetes bacterium]|nr:hypothetical protein [Planctomycetota bacterium]
MRLLASFMILGFALSGACAHAAAAAGNKSLAVPKGWPNDATVKPAEQFKKITGADGKLGLVYVFAASIDGSDKDAVKRVDDFNDFVKKVIADKDTIKFMESNFVVFAIRANDKSMGGRNVTVKEAGIAIINTDGQKLSLLETPLDSAVTFRNMLMQAAADAAKQRTAKAAEKAKEEAQRKKEEEEAKKREKEKEQSGKVPGLDDSGKTAAKKTESKTGTKTGAGAVTDE